MKNAFSTRKVYRWTPEETYAVFFPCTLNMETAVSAIERVVA